jgi:hypothetical protein
MLLVREWLVFGLYHPQTAADEREVIGRAGARFVLEILGHWVLYQE